ncbi:polyphosphate kinase 1 [Eupransor demetentiae]|uniref:Polyphosphate kinase n=1 Tax=Eupransor demetentiae TaxID=3109584 RepID=A0ABP0ESZ8_9LACO|nr:Polyphosphate kinase (Ppk) [Lactobacillaceae bacterium LMG 33000]
MNVNNPHYFNSRESSWVDFDFRVLEEAADHTNPLLERLRFLGITQSNLDDFFSVRVATLLKKKKEKEPDDAAGNSPHEQLDDVLDKIHALVARQGHILRRMILPQLSRHQIKLLNWKKLNQGQKEYFENFFEDTIFPEIEPMPVDSSGEIPFLVNDSINFLVRVQGQSKKQTAIIPLPGNINRILALPGVDNQFILLEDVITHFLPRFFPGQSVKASALFKITRYMDYDVNDRNAKKYKQAIVKTLEERAHGNVIRLETTASSNPDLVEWLAKRYHLKKAYIFTASAPLELDFVNALIKQVKGHTDLLFQPFSPYEAQLFQDHSMFELIRKNDLFLHHPYDSFEPVLRFVHEAALDPKVIDIKMTLYRVSKDSPLIQSLLEAAKKGKEVTIMIELKARSDEANNLKWADELEASGCQVLYGIPGLKVHSKLCLITRLEDHQEKNYVHLATGNYNDKTAKLYTDMGLFTANPAIGRDAVKIFDMLSKESQQPELEELVISPNNIRDFLIAKIDREIRNHKAGKPAAIRMKMNSLSDIEMIKKLYEANAAGVKSDLIVRGICDLRTGIPGVSDKITVHSIVGRLLEHSRIYIFENAGRVETYLSSADLMKRNLSRRVEILFPILDARLNEDVQEIFTWFEKDNVKARTLIEKDQWARIHHRGIKCFNVQEFLISNRKTIADKRLKQTGFQIES